MKVSELQIQNQLSQFDIGRVRSNDSTVQKPNQPVDKNQNFSDILDKKISEDHSIRFSSHASKRLVERNMQVGEDQLQRLENGMSRVKEKGAKSSLFLMDEMAFVVSVKNQTVVTALDREAAKSNVFTNIDSVAIV